MIFTQKIELRPFKKRLIINFSHQCFFVENNYFLNVNVWKFLICQCIKNMGLIYLVFFVCSIRIWKKKKKFQITFLVIGKQQLLSHSFIPFAQLEPLAVISKSSLCPSSKEDFLLVVENPLQLSICYWKTCLLFFFLSY